MLNDRFSLTYVEGILSMSNFTDFLADPSFFNFIKGARLCFQALLLRQMAIQMR